MNRAIGMDWATVAHRAQLLLLLVLLANRLERRQNFIPIPIALFHSIYFPLMFRAIRMAGLVAKTLGCGARCEE